MNRKLTTNGGKCTLRLDKGSIYSIAWISNSSHHFWFLRPVSFALKVVLVSRILRPSDETITRLRDKVMRVRSQLPTLFVRATLTQPPGGRILMISRKRYSSNTNNIAKYQTVASFYIKWSFVIVAMVQIARTTNRLVKMIKKTIIISIRDRISLKNTRVGCSNWN